MSRTHTLLSVLKDKKPHTIREMSEATGMTIDEIDLALACLRKQKCTRALDIPYLITDAGVEWLDRHEARAKLAAEKAARPRNPPGRPRKKAVPVKVLDPEFNRSFVAAPFQRDSIVSTAINAQPALQAAWGSLNA